MEYTYNIQNQVTRIKDAAINPNSKHGVKDFKGFVYDFAVGANDSKDHYTYDANGNLKTDAHKGILNIEYNYLNLPQVITFTGNRTITFIYDASGAKLRKIVQNGTAKDSTDYIGGVEYKNNILQRIAHTEGAVVRNQYGYYDHEYVLRDHLGNTRVTFKDGESKGEAYFDWNTWSMIDPNVNNAGYNDGVITQSDITQINMYYPYGLNAEGPWNGKDGTNKYQFSGKELNDDFGLGWSDFGARFYDPANPHWVTIDPLAEKMRRYSPYCYAFDNPMRFVDPDGMAPTDDYKLKKNGELQLVQKTNDKSDKIISEDGKNSIIVNKIASISQNDKGLVLWFSDVKSGDKFYKFAAKNTNVEFGKIEGKYPNKDYKEATVYTSYNESILRNGFDVKMGLSKSGFSAETASHSHPPDSYDTRIPSGYFGVQEGNPMSLMPIPNANDNDAGGARYFKKQRGFEIQFLT